MSEKAVAGTLNNPEYYTPKCMEQHLKLAHVITVVSMQHWAPSIDVYLLP